LDGILRQFGADESKVDDKSEVITTTHPVEVECNRYGLLVLGCLLGDLPLRYLLCQSYISSSFAVRRHAVMILVKMCLDVEYGEAVAETVDAALGALLQPLPPQEIQHLTDLIVSKIREPAMQFLLLCRLPSYSPLLGTFRHNLAKLFLDISPTAELGAFLECLKSRSPFAEIQRDMANEHTRQLKYCMLIFDVAVTHPHLEHKEITRAIVKQLQNMHTRIIDGRAAFLVRTEAKEVIQRVWMRLEYSMHGGRKRMESLDQYGLHS
jgi:hypothetical protein